MTGYRLIATDGEHQATIEIKRSRFIATVARAADEEEARSVIDRLRAEHWQANHNCSAWRIGVGGRSQRTSDDGEPSGTAGIPMLEVLKRRDVTDVVAVVTRYFGGVLLGAGGLIRAYGQAVTAALDGVGIVERRPLQVVAVRASHQDAGRLDNALRMTDYTLGDVAYADRVTFELHLSEEDLPGFTAWLAEATGGRSVPEVVGTRFVEVPVTE
jgi:uncharacterized YigZ family protein